MWRETGDARFANTPPGGIHSDKISDAVAQQGKRVMLYSMVAFALLFGAVVFVVSVKCSMEITRNLF